MTAGRRLARLLIMILALVAGSAALGAQDLQTAPKTSARQPTTRKKGARAQKTAAKEEAAPKADIQKAEPAPAAEPAAKAGQKPEPAREPDFITPHVMNGHEIEIPWPGRGLSKTIELPQWAPIRIGSLELDLSPTKHVVMLWIASVLCVVTLVGAARSVQKRHAQGRASGGFGGAIEAMVLYLRNEVILPNVGPHGEGFVPYCLAAFFFILFCNLLGLIPGGATATGNISVTATMAILSFILIEVAGIRALGKHYIDTIIWWPRDVPLGARILVTPIMTPVEILGKFTKPFALAMRLFANMTAGHIAVLALVGLVFGLTAKTWYLSVLPVALATGIMMLETFVAFLQAFIFMLLSAVFIGLIRSSHH